MVGLRLEEIPGPKTSFFKEIVLSHSVYLLFMHTEPKDRVEKITLLLAVRYVDRETVSKTLFFQTFPLGRICGLQGFCILGKADDWITCYLVVVFVLYMPEDKTFC